jgi:hypothetical protein
MFEHGRFVEWRKTTAFTAWAVNSVFCLFMKLECVSFLRVLRVAKYGGGYGGGIFYKQICKSSAPLKLNTIRL